MGNCPLLNVRERGPITNRAGGNYVTQFYPGYNFYIFFVQIPVTFSLFVFS